MSRMGVVSVPWNTLGASERSDYDALVASCRHSTVFHTAAWLDALDRCFSPGTRCLIARQDAGSGPAVGAFPYFSLPDPWPASTNHSCLRDRDMVYGGPLVLPVGSPRQREIIGALLERFESGLPTVTSVILPPPDFPSHLLESRGYRISSHLTAVIDLDGTEEDAWRAIHPKTRNMISKARRCGVRVHVAGEESLHVLPSMVASAFARAGKEPPPAGFLMTVARILGRRGLAHVLTATRDDRPVAAAIFLYHRDRSYYWAGGASEEGYLTGASHLVQWEGIRAALENGCSLHDLVMVSPAQAPGIARFKIRFGARIVPLQTATRRSLVGRILGRVS